MLGSVCVYFRSPIHRRRLVCMIDATVCRGVTRSEAVWVEGSEGGHHLFFVFSEMEGSVF